MQEGKVQKWHDAVDSELYEELLNRYERILVYAGQLQEKLRQQALLAEKNESVEKEKDRLKRLLANEESYVLLLENSLRALGVMPEDKA
ncbi:MAG: hypothetical protein ACRD1R_07070 [Acidobacteriota bacterium]